MPWLWRSVVVAATGVICPGRRRRRTLACVEDVPRKKKSPTAGIRKQMPDDEWERWIEEFRKHPGETVKVAQIMGVPRNRARIAWHHGWPRQGRPAIVDLVAVDQYAARVKRAEREEAAAPLPVPALPAASKAPPPKRSPEPPVQVTSARDLAIHGPERIMAQMLERDKRRQLVAADSAKTRAEEGMMISTARRNGIALAAVTAQLIRMANGLMPKIAEIMKVEAVSVKDAVTMVQKIAVITRLGTEASKMALQMERAAMGEPMSDDIKTNGRLDPEQAADWVLMGMRAVERFKQRQGGGTDEDEGRSAQESSPRAGEDEDDEDDEQQSDAGLASVGRPELPN